jgi:hypothetical protein
MVFQLTALKPFRRCLSCGHELPPRNRKWCSADCPGILQATLNRRSGLLRALHARYATFCFSEASIFLNVLLYGSKQIHGYMLPRQLGGKPIDDLCRLSNLLGRLWWSEKDRTQKFYLANQLVLERATQVNASIDSIRPSIFVVPSTKSSNLVRLEIDPDDLKADDLKTRIKAAYRRQAMKNHPDQGGDGKTFIKIQEAYVQLSEWAKHPTFRHRSGLADKWLYSGADDRWHRPVTSRRKRKR